MMMMTMMIVMMNSSQGVNLLSIVGSKSRENHASRATAIIIVP